MDTLTFFRDEGGILRCNYRKPLPIAVAATVGTFDGVHLGHRYLIQVLQDKAAELALPTMVITFDRPPVATVCPGHPYAKINDNAEREALLAQRGVDYTVVLPFDRALANLPAEAFLRDLLRDLLHVKLLVSGYDHRLGRRIPKTEDPEAEQLAARLGLLFFRANSAKDRENEDYSSSRIRKLLRAGRVEEANLLLGYHYTFCGRVVSGNGIGRGFGYPTANIELNDPHKLAPRNGVYAARAVLPEGEVAGMLYIGNRPTIGGNLDFTIELNLFDFAENLYGKPIRVSLDRFVRGECKFETREALQAQLALDESHVRRILGLVTEEASPFGAGNSIKQTFSTQKSQK